MLLSKGLALLAVCSLAAGRYVDMPDKTDCRVGEFDEPRYPAALHDQVRFPFSVRQDPAPVVPPTSEDTLRKIVDETFMDRLPKDPKLLEVRDNVTVTIASTKNPPGSGGAFMAVDISNPKMDTCKPILSDLQRLGEGIYCSQDNGCSMQHAITIQYEYSTVTGFKMGASLKASGGIKGLVEIEMAVSYETSFQAEWKRAQSTTNTYTFNLKKGESCTPSMMHIDLECEATTGTYLFDTWWEDRPGQLKLEYQLARGGGPYKSGQWCTEVLIKERAMKQQPMSKYWKPLLAGDVHRGYMYMRPTSDLNRYKAEGQEHIEFSDDEIAIHRHFADAGRDALIFKCKRKLRDDQKNTVRVPLQGQSGELLGFIGCVGK